MKNNRIWNPIYKRFECKNCLNEWGINENHVCIENKKKLSIVDIFWESLPVEDKKFYRKMFNSIDEYIYKKYDDVSHYAFCNRDKENLEGIHNMPLRGRK